MNKLVALFVFISFAGCGTKSDTAAPPSAAPPVDAGTDASGGSGGNENGGAAGSTSKGGGQSGSSPIADAGIDATPGQNGDLGGGSVVIDHSGANNGVVGSVQSGAISGSTWTASGCGDVDLASGVTDAQWSSEAYDSGNPAPESVHASFRFDSSSSLSVVWQTAPGTLATWLAIGDSPTSLNRFAEGTSFTYAYSTLDSKTPKSRIHEAHMCGLTPGRTYYYAVGGDGYYGTVHAVKTAPAAAKDATFRVGVLGDSNNIAYDQFQIIAAQLRKATPDWALFTGDLVHDGTIQSEWDDWFSAEGDFFAEAPLMTAHGNHEMMATAYFAQFSLPGKEEYYSFDYAQAHVVVLNDSPPMDSEFAVEAKFLDDDLAAATTRATPPVFLIAMHHRPAYSSPNTNLEVQTTFAPIYDKYHVDLVLNGHEHVYESTLPIKNGKVVATPAEGTIYITTGGAGSDITDPPGQAAFSRTYAMVYNYVVIDVAGSMLTLAPFGVDGASLETPIVISK